MTNLARTASLVAALLLLTSCGESTPVFSGEIVGCNRINQIENPSQNLTVGCLDNSVGINIAAVKGPAIINVWGSWCEPCKEELPYLMNIS